MHSSRMRISQILPSLQRPDPLQRQPPPPPVNRMTHTCENITCPALQRYAVSKNVFDVF